MEKRRCKKIAWNLALITAGSLLCVVAIKGILVPQQFLAGSITGSFNVPSKFEVQSTVP